MALIGQKFPKFFLCLFSFWGIWVWSAPALALLPQEPESLVYDLRVFNLVSTLKVRMEIQPGEEKDTYLAHLSLKPVGVFKHFAPYKSLDLHSKLRLLPQSNRLRTEYFEKKLVSKRIYRGIYRYDYEKGVVIGQGFFNDRALAAQTFPLPKESGAYYDDFLSFIYNFRSGGYGDLNPGEKVYIRTVPTKKQAMFELEVADQKRSSQFDPVKGAAHFMVLHLNEKFLGFHADQFYFWLSEEYFPLHGVLKDVVGWGDVVWVFQGNEEHS